MHVKDFIDEMKLIGIDTLVGIPDSTLKQLCVYINSMKDGDIFHYVPANEGAAVGIAIGSYLSSGKPACIYMQNSGLGNVINPLTSLAHQDVYGIPALFLIGWRGEPGIHDEPQHKFMGRVTCDLLSCMEIKFRIIDANMDQGQLRAIFKEAMMEMALNRQFAIIVKKDTFIADSQGDYTNPYILHREDAIKMMASCWEENDLIVSSTGKISRELYEISKQLNKNQGRSFMTVGGMGHASMIAFGVAVKKTWNRVYCLDGDGAVLMHMGALAFIGKQAQSNLVHVCLNNEAHESVGGMPTGAVGVNYSEIASTCGYKKVYSVSDPETMRDCMDKIKVDWQLTFLEVKVAMDSREDLGRPKEPASQNKSRFMEYCKGEV